MNKIDMTKKYVYRNGQPARVLCIDVKGYQPVVSTTENGAVFCHNSDGAYRCNREVSE